MVVSVLWEFRAGTGVRSCFARYPTLFAMKLQKGWGTRFCGGWRLSSRVEPVGQAGGVVGDDGVDVGVGHLLPAFGGVDGVGDDLQAGLVG